MSSGPHAVLILAAAILAHTGCEGDRAKQSRTDAVVQALQTVSRTGRGLPGPHPAAAELVDLRRLYEGSGHTPLWFSASGDLRGAGKEILLRLADADAEGLRPDDYSAARLDSLARQVSEQKAADPQAVARLDAGLSLAVLQFLRHVHVGRVNPRSIGLSMDPPRERHDYVTLLGAALRDGTLDEMVSELAPPLDQYRLVREALAGYRKRQADSGAEDPIRLSVPLKPGETADGLDALARRLALTGDLASQSDTAVPARYEGALVEAVRRFQARHGLTPDSVLGKETLAELNVPWSWRIHQLELSLERLRWLRDLGHEPFLLVNIPMFELTAWSSPMAAGPPAFRTGVIVGKALDTETPVFVEEMRYVVFQPFWNIPPSITRDETIPAIERDSEYLRKSDMEIVQGQGDDADPVELSDGTLEKLARGELRVRQRPGPSNALGPIKFVFPNNQNIYLHSTPAEQLFDRTRRDFSHGCVRVEDVAGLAEWVLSGQAEWTRERITLGPERSHPHLTEGRSAAAADGGTVLLHGGCRAGRHGAVCAGHLPARPKARPGAAPGRGLIKCHTEGSGWTPPLRFAQGDNRAATRRERGRYRRGRSWIRGSTRRRRAARRARSYGAGRLRH